MWFRRKRSSPTVDARGPIVARSGEDYRQHLQTMIACLPWFGDEPFPASPEPPARDVLARRPAVRRILLAVLAGRPLSRAAQRAGCSVRLVYKVLAHVLYVASPEAMVEEWARLGLIGILDVPGGQSGQALRGLHGAAIGGGEGVAVCLLCHRAIGDARIDDPAHDGRLVEVDDTGWAAFALPWESVEAAHTHLILHFPLGPDPIASAGREWRQRLGRTLAEAGSLEMAGLLALTAPRRRVAWREVVPEGVVHQVYQARHQGARWTRPVVNGQALSQEAAEAWWSRRLVAPTVQKSKARRR